MFTVHSMWRLSTTLTESDQYCRSQPARNRQSQPRPRATELRLAGDGWREMGRSREFWSGGLGPCQSHPREVPRTTRLVDSAREKLWRLTPALTRDGGGRQAAGGV